MRGGWRRLKRAVTRSSAIAAVGWCAFAIYLVVQARLGPPLVWNDSTVYVGMAHRALWSRAVWVGPRPPLTPLLLKVAGGATATVTIQSVIAAVAWGTLAGMVSRLVGPGWRRYVAGFAVLAFASTLPIVMWNRSELSESLSLSLLALVVAGFIAVARRPTWGRVAATALACLGFAATRDAQVWTVAILALVTGVYAATRFGVDPSTGRRAGALALGLLGVVALCEWGTLASHRTTPNTADVLFVRVFPFPDRVAWFADHGMPQAGRIDQLARTTATPPDGVKVVGISPHNPAFQPVERWLRADGDATYLLWLATHPVYVVSEPLRRPERALNFAQGDLLFYAPANHTLRSPQTTLLWPPLTEALMLAAVAAYLGIVTNSWRDRAWWTVVVLTLVGVAGMLVAWHGDGQEVTRHTIEGMAEARLGVWILLVVGLLRLPAFDPNRSREARAAPVESATPIDAIGGGSSGPE